uniref:Uncharacterized protein n=1 Tax=Nelumbo nucifera TaxID=4432 RepID=A0A822ZTY7_NELNU|nr:TPA_asm: hypothetical protein HUJ06_004576 [Nelumbo nucifera]
MKFGNNGNEQIVNQTTDVNANVYSRLPSHLDFIDLSRRFPLYFTLTLWIKEMAPRLQFQTCP